MEQWRQERNMVLHWWPKILAGQKPEGHVFVNSLEEDAWGASNNKDWNNWILQVGKIWPINNFSESFNLLQFDKNIDVHLGPTLGHALHYKILHLDKKIILEGQTSKQNISQKSLLKKDINTTEFFNTQPTRITYDQSVYLMAEKLLIEFGLKEVVVSLGSSSVWLKKQLTDAHIGLAHMAMVLGVANHYLGHGQLRIWFHEKSRISGAVMSNFDHIEIHQGGGNVAQIWALWRMSNKKNNIDIHQIISAWRKLWIKSVRKQIDHQEQFLNKSQQAFKKILNEVSVTSDMGQKMFRRYRASCKWFDDIYRGMSRSTLQQSWNKLKIGNRIAWSGDQSNNFSNIITQWGWEERLIEVAFWKFPHWHIPSWVQRYLAVSNGSWVRNDEHLSNDDCLALWALGFEALVRQRIGYDGWVAIQNICHPEQYEGVEFFQFFDEYLHKYL